MTNAKIDSIKARIRALTAKTVGNGCSEAEAEAAISMVGKLLSQYNLSMDECDVREEGCIGIHIQSGSKQRHGVFYAISAIAALTKTESWLTRHHNGIVYSFFGQESDVIVAKYLFEVIDNAIKSEVLKFKKTDTYLNSFERKATSSSFIVGMGTRLGQRVREMIQQESGLNSTGNALMVIKDQIVTEEFAKLNMNLKTKKDNTQIKDGNAFHQGKLAANNVHLARGVSGSDQTRLRIA